MQADQSNPEAEEGSELGGGGIGGLGRWRRRGRRAAARRDLVRVGGGREINFFSGSHLKYPKYHPLGEIVFLGSLFQNNPKITHIFGSWRIIWAI